MNRKRYDRTTNPPILILTTETRIALSNLSDLFDAKRRVRDAGSHYFDADTIRYFRARYHAWTSLSDGSIMIVESIKRTGFGSPDGPREYRVIRVTIEGEIRSFKGQGIPGGIEGTETFRNAARARARMYSRATIFEDSGKRKRETPEIGGE